MVNVIIKCSDCGKEIAKIIGAKSKESILQKYTSFVCECGQVIAEEPYAVFDKYEKKKTGKKITQVDPETEEKTLVDEWVTEKKFKTITPDKKISAFF